MSSYSQKRSLRRIRCLGCLLFLGMPIFAGGCSEKKRQQIAAAVTQRANKIADAAVEKANDFTAQASETVSEVLPAEGKVTLKTAEGFETDSAIVQLISIGDGRENVVQITSYEPGTKNLSYPSLLIRGKTMVGDAASLSGESIDCQLYLQASSSAPIAATPPDGTISVTFRSFDPEKKTLTASISNGSLLDTNNQPVRVSGGNLVAVVKGSS